MSLDITTPKGRIAAQHQHDAITIIKRSMPGVEFAETSDKSASAVDAFAVRDSILVAAFEVKSRDMTLAELQQYDNEWLITFDKVMSGASIAHYLRIPFYGLLYLPKEGKVLMQQIAGTDGELIPEMSIRKSTTQATCNGGIAHRVNAYIDMTNARVFQ